MAVHQRQTGQQAVVDLTITIALSHMLVSALSYILTSGWSNLLISALLYALISPLHAVSNGTHSCM